MKIGYYAIFNYDNVNECEYGISIYFPDLPAAYTCARNDEEGKKFAKEVLELVTDDMMVGDLPKRTELCQIQLKANEKVFFIEYETSESTVMRLWKNK